MKFSRYAQIVSLLGALLGTSSALAQSWYQIEVILFTQDFPELQQSATSEEAWPTELDLKWQSPLLPMFEAGSLQTPALRKLPVEKRTMNGDAYAFRVTDGYHLLWHQAWQQPLVDEADAPWILIKGGAELDGHSELEGSLRVHLSRFLHVTTDLWLTDFANPDDLQPEKFFLSQLPQTPELYSACQFFRYQPEIPQEQSDILYEPPATESWWTPPYGCELARQILQEGRPRYAPLSPVAAPLMQEISYQTEFSSEPQRMEIPLPQVTVVQPTQLYLPVPEITVLINDRPVKQITHIQTDRRMRSQEFHFIDHPKLGMLIRVLEVERPLLN